MHVNARSLGKKLDLLEAESEHFDITLSETWLSKKDDNNDLHLTNFHSAVRQDRADTVAWQFMLEITFIVNYDQTCT